MAKISNRFQILLTDEEVRLLKSEAEKRNISQGELLRLALKNEVYKKSSLNKRNALHRFVEFLD